MTTITFDANGCDLLIIKNVLKALGAKKIKIVEESKVVKNSKPKSGKEKNTARKESSREL